VPERVWHRLRDALLGMKIRRKIRGELKWRFFAPNNDDSRNPMKDMSQDERDTIRAEIYSIMTKEKAVKTLAAVCSIQAAYRMPSVTDQQGIYNLSYKTITERFQYYLQDQSRASGSATLGLIICDHRGKGDDKRLQAHHQMLVHSTAAFTSRYENLVESVLSCSAYTQGLREILRTNPSRYSGSRGRRYCRKRSLWNHLWQSPCRSSKIAAGVALSEIFGPFESDAGRHLQKEQS